MTTSEIKTLTAKRSQLKSQLSRFQYYLSKFDENSDIIELETRLENIKDISQRFEEIQDQIEILSESEIQYEERDRFENSFYKAVAQAKTMLTQNLEKTVQIQNTNQNYADTVNIQGEVKLPHLKF